MSNVQLNVLAIWINEKYGDSAEYITTRESQGSATMLKNEKGHLE